MFYINNYNYNNNYICDDSTLRKLVKSTLQFFYF